FSFFHHTAPSVLYPLSLHDALPIYTFSFTGCFDPTPASARHCSNCSARNFTFGSMKIFSCDPGMRLIRTPSFASPLQQKSSSSEDRKSTRLNSSHLGISYAVFCLKK